MMFGLMPNAEATGANARSRFAPVERIVGQLLVVAVNVSQATASRCYRLEKITDTNKSAAETMVGTSWEEL
jgi:hypothetical protein